MPNTFSVLMHHKISTQSQFAKTVIAETISQSLESALLAAYERSRKALAELPEGEISLFIRLYPGDITQTSYTILDCTIDYDLLFI